MLCALEERAWSGLGTSVTRICHLRGVICKQFYWCNEIATGLVAQFFASSLWSLWHTVAIDSTAQAIAAVIANIICWTTDN